MFKYRKKPIEIEAFQHDPSGGDETRVWPTWLLRACADGTITVDGSDTYVVTLEGRMLVSPGDWIIRGVKGELYPCKPDIFAASYDPVT